MLNFEKWKVTLILVVSVLGILYALPNLFSEEDLKSWPDALPNEQMNLGLDLQGGVHLLLEVDMDEVVQARLEALRDDVLGALRGKRGERESIQRTGLGIVGDSVRVRITKPGQIPEAVKRLRDLAQPVSQGLLANNVFDLEVTEIDDQRIELNLTQEALEARRRQILSESIEVVRRRIDELGTREPSIQRQGLDRIILQVPGESDPQRIINLLRQTAKMSFHDVDTSVTIAEAQRGRIPPGSMLLPSDREEDGFNLVKRRALISGERLVQASVGTHPQNGVPIVNFRFDNVGSKIFADHTAKNVGRPFAVVLDGKVITAPRINSAILGGSGYIEGNFTFETANDLAILLNAGALPATLAVIEQRTVGPDLGADSIAAGQFAALIGFVAVIVFIIISYGLFGIFANIALILNLILVAGALSMLGATLTLPGIAGIVLTIGMAVDANVLIFERIREEISAGKTPINAVEAGYSRALSTIADANITTFIAAAILFQLGSGPIKGFSVTLAIGIVTSVFTAFTVTRLMVATWIRQKRPQALPI